MLTDLNSLAIIVTLLEMTYNGYVVDEWIVRRYISSWNLDILESCPLSEDIGQ